MHPVCIATSGRFTMKTIFRFLSAASRLWFFILPATLVAVAFSAAALPDSLDNLLWDEGYSLTGTGHIVAGTKNTVYAAVTDDTGNLYIGGSFTIVHNTFANNIARWDGTRWSALGKGVDGVVRTILAAGTDVYVGGEFTQADGKTVNYIARWDGSKWTDLDGGMSGSEFPYVYALAMYNGELVAGGWFKQAGSQPANYIARWNGSQWQTLGPGMDDAVAAFTQMGTDLYAAGWFTQAGGASASHVAKWDGSAWSALGTGTNDVIRTLAAIGTTLYAGGNFTQAGGVTANRVAKWNGTAWSAMGTGMNTWVLSLAPSGTYIYAGGEFTSAGGKVARFVARWSGSGWFTVGVSGVDDTGLNNAVNAVAVYSGQVYIGGEFIQAGSNMVNHVARLATTQWLPLGDGTDGDVNALWASAPSNIIAVGGFGTIQGVKASRVARWDGSTWQALGAGVSKGPYPVAYSAAQSGSNVYVGGWFGAAGTVNATNVAQWNGTAWSAMSTGLAGGVYALTVWNGKPYAGGDFDGFVTQWDGSAWSAVGGGADGPVNALLATGGYLYAGGDFTFAGAVLASRVARWDGTAWAALGSGMNSSVYALAAGGEYIYAAGDFTRAGGAAANRVARWDGTQWSPLGAGLNGVVYAMAATDRHVYVGGNFTMAGNAEASHIARWDGYAWEPLGSGVNNDIQTLALIGDGVLAGGVFSMAGEKISGYLARWTPRVNRDTRIFTANPGAVTLGGQLPALFKPVLSTNAGAVVVYDGGVPVSVTLCEARQINVGGHRVNGAVDLGPSGVIFGGAGATLRVEFSEDDAAAYGVDWTDFGAVRLLYPATYPANKEAVGVLEAAKDAPVPLRIERGKQIYGITFALPAIASTYGAVPKRYAISSHSLLIVR